MPDSDQQILLKFLKFIERNYSPEEAIRLIAIIVRITDEKRNKK